MGLIKQLTLTPGPGIIAQELFDVLPELSPKKITLPDDPVALACCSYRIWKQGGHRWAELTTMIVSEEDRREAEALKSYYRERLVFEALKKTGEANVSGFRKKLALLVADNLDITRDEIGMLMRLPYFYEEDRAVDALVAATSPAQEYLKSHEVKTTFKLHSRVFRSRRSGDYYDYWMTTDHSPAAYLFVMRHDNNLRLLIESLLDKPFPMKANLYTHNMRGYWRGRPYYQVVFTGMA